MDEHTAVRELLADATRPPLSADPIAAVRQRARRLQRRRLTTATTMGAVAVLGMAGGASLMLTGDDDPDVVQTGATPTASTAPSKDTAPGLGDPAEAAPGLPALGRLVGSHPEAFVGLYVDSSNRAVIVFGPDVDQTAWTTRIAATAGTVAYRITSCGTSRMDLDAIASRVAAFAWPSGKPAMAIDVDPSTCSVRVTSQALTGADITAAHNEFGAAITIDNSGHPTRR